MPQPRRADERGAELAASARNPDIAPDAALALLKNNSLPPEAVSLIALNPRLSGSYKIKRAVANHPGCPLKLALSMLKHLRIFDLADITRNRFVKAELRHKVELMIDERLSALPAGVKIALIKRCSPELIVRIMEKSESHVIAACLDSPLMTESRLYGIVVKHSTHAPVIRAVAEHPRWSLRYDIRMALVRNFHTPMARVVEFIEHLRATDLELLYQDPSLPSATRPFIHQALGERATRPVWPDEITEERHEIPEDADEGIFDPPDGE